MKKQNLKFGDLGKISTRRFPNPNFASAAYKSDGKDPGDEDEDDEEDEDEDEETEEEEDETVVKEKRQFMKKIKGTVTKEIEKRGYKNSDELNKLVDDKLKSLNLEALRNFDAAKVNKTLKNLAAEQEKMKSGNAEDKKVNLRSILNDKMKDIELLFRAKASGKEIKLNIRAAAVMATDNTIDENSYPDEMIESMSLAEFVPKRYGNQFIYDIVDREIVGEIEQYTTWLEEGDEEGAFAIVAEGGLKPLVSTALVRNYAEAKKVAGKYIVTEEFVKWRKKAYAIIRRLINDKLVRDYIQLLVTDLNAEAVAYTGTILDDQFVAPNDYDAIGAAAAQIEALNFYPDVLIINPQDKWRIALQKDTTGAYYLTIPTYDPNGVMRMMGFQVVVSTYQPAGTFTLGESKLFKVEEEAITVRMGYGITVTGANPVTNVVSDFDNNQMRIIVEMFFKDWLATNHAGSFVRDTFANVKAALLKP